jgi:hypothetical protein
VKGDRESRVLKNIRAALGREPGCFIWRNNTGVDLARGIRYGLGVGSADLVGVVAPYGRFLAIEVKRERGGVVGDDQRAWLALVVRAGGVAGIVRSVEQALRLLMMARSASLLPRVIEFAPPPRRKRAA